MLKALHAGNLLCEGVFITRAGFHSPFLRHLSIYLSIYLAIYLSIHPSTHLSTHLSICLFVDLIYLHTFMYSTQTYVMSLDMKYQFSNIATFAHEGKKGTGTSSGFRITKKKLIWEPHNGPFFCWQIHIEVNARDMKWEWWWWLSMALFHAIRSKNVACP